MLSNEHSNKGYIHLYTGNGKGKTTAALGLALRATGAGKRIFIAQFVKGLYYSEHELLQGFPAIEMKQFGRGCFIINQPEEEDVLLARNGFHVVQNMINKAEHDLVILDEICIALYYGLIDEKELLALLSNKPLPMDIVLTGRYASETLIDACDLVTEMKEVKHYYHQGVEARKGIEF